MTVEVILTCSNCVVLKPIIVCLCIYSEWGKNKFRLSQRKVSKPKSIDNDQFQGVHDAVTQTDDVATQKDDAATQTDAEMASQTDDVTVTSASGRAINLRHK